MKQYTIGNVQIGEDELRKIIKDNPEILNEPEKPEKDLDRFWFGDNGWLIEHTYVNQYERTDSDHVMTFKTETKAEKELNKQQALIRLWKYAQERNMILDCDWKDYQGKYFPTYDHHQEAVSMGSVTGYQTQFELPFMTKKNCERFIKDCKSDLKIYFGLTEN